MDLAPFGYAIGISDVLAYRDCPERFAWGMRRHVGDEPPEATNGSNVYGSTIHEVINQIELGATHEDAIATALQEFGTYLTPQDISLLREDVEQYERRHPSPDEWELVSAERDMRVPLFVHEGQQIFFRFRLDVLFRNRVHRDVFLHRDYKSTAHNKTAAEVHADPQMWAYAWAIHELWPECRQLFQEMDLLKFGVQRTTKNAQQRAEMKQWLVANVKTILDDDKLAPKLNQWCAYCPMVATCKEPRRATRTTRAKLAISAPMRKDGRKIRVEFLDDADEMERIIRDELPMMREVRKHIEHVEKALKEVLEGMTDEERERLGWRISERRSKTLTPEGLRELHALLGDSFYELVNLPITRLEEFVGKPKKGEPKAKELELAERMATESVSATSLVSIK